MRAVDSREMWSFHGEVDVVPFAMSQGLKAATKKQKYDMISEKKMSTPVEARVLLVDCLLACLFADSSRHGQPGTLGRSRHFCFVRRSCAEATPMNSAPISTTAARSSSLTSRTIRICAR